MEKLFPCIALLLLSVPSYAQVKCDQVNLTGLWALRVKAHDSEGKLIDSPHFVRFQNIETISHYQRISIVAAGKDGFTEVRAGFPWDSKDKRQETVVASYPMISTFMSLDRFTGQYTCTLRLYNPEKNSFKFAMISKISADGSEISIGCSKAECHEQHMLFTIKRVSMNPEIKDLDKEKGQILERQRMFFTPPKPTPEHDSAASPIGAGTAR